MDDANFSRPRSQTDIPQERRTTFSSIRNSIKVPANPFRKGVTLSKEESDTLNHSISNEQKTTTTTTTTTTNGNSNTTQTNVNTNNSAEYESYLQKAKTEDFTEEAKYGFLYRSGIDTAGRPIVVIIAARFPSGKNVNMDRLLLYVLSVMDDIVNNEYSIVYVQTQNNGNSGGTPGFQWLRKAYRILNRKYKKNLKSLYIIHPTMWVKGIMRFFKPLISSKFWQKLTYIEEVNDIYKFIHRDQLKLPDFVVHYSKQGPKKVVPVFGTPLDEVLSRVDHSEYEVPIVVDKSVRYLMEGKANTVQGIFRLSGSSQQIQQLRKDFDKGENVNLETVDDPHVVAGLLKLYLREMPEPLFPFDMYDRLIGAYKSGGNIVDNLYALLEDLPTNNKALLRYVLSVLSYVEMNASVNQMTSSNLSIVFAPNVIRSPQETMQQAIMHAPIINSILRIIIENHAKLLPALETSPHSTIKPLPLDDTSN